jgi:hypothetical protein
LHSFPPQQQQQQHGWLLGDRKRHISCNSTASTAALNPQPVAARQAKQTAASKDDSSSSSKAHGNGAQTLDFTTLTACCHELTEDWVPSKVEEVSRCSISQDRPCTAATQGTEMHMEHQLVQYALTA